MSSTTNDNTATVVLVHGAWHGAWCWDRVVPLLEAADVVVVRFGEQYRQWNAAFDAGMAAAFGKPLVTLHPEQHDHALKEVDRAALAVAREPEQVVEILRYVTEGVLR